MLTVRLLVDADDQAELDQLAAGVFDGQVVSIDAGMTGSLIRTELRPLSVTFLSALAAADSRAERMGPLVRVFLERPTEVRPDDG